ncbi:hypothetical protein [Nocardia aurantiaca]|uniref:hypothetical protein n=1 Tax=Nocardia aurantiaca TaxID=2675850 RepID=UPI001E2C34C5|nr:hypothetical protein [Nocardia aurantiaca]
MTWTLGRRFSVVFGVAALLVAEATTAFAEPTGATPLEQLRRDTESIHALGISGVQARVIAPDGGQLVATTELQQLWPGGRYGLGLAERPLSCGGTFWSHEGGDAGYITLNGVTPDGARSATVSMSEALGDSPNHILDQETAATTLIDHALCADAR